MESCALGKIGQYECSYFCALVHGCKISYEDPLSKRADIAVRKMAKKSIAVTCFIETSERKNVT